MSSELILIYDLECLTKDLFLHHGFPTVKLYATISDPYWTLFPTSPERDSNPRYSVLQSTALPLSYERGGCQEGIASA
ncbi:hypothetical protein OUZ56_019684 [Daphnia magna]|uniref:Uncharacterized protein n=1 Tax=Daphnia magna TaxID=35525 RepID=A0ABQ9ZCV7_9CRUS|nr:hypothetical protein OUZ56_019684 [Daphnia magna]